MLPLFETEVLLVSIAATHLLKPEASCTIKDQNGAVVAEAHDCGPSAGKWLTAVFSRHVSNRRWEWDLLDGYGNRVAHIVKPMNRSLMTALRSPRARRSRGDENQRS